MAVYEQYKMVCIWKNLESIRSTIANREIEKIFIFLYRFNCGYFRRYFVVKTFMRIFSTFSLKLKFLLKIEFLSCLIKYQDCNFDQKMQI